MDLDSPSPRLIFVGLPNGRTSTRVVGLGWDRRYFFFQDARWRSAVVAPAREFTVFLGTIILERNNNAFDGPLCVYEQRY